MKRDYIFFKLKKNRERERFTSTINNNENNVNNKKNDVDEKKIKENNENQFIQCVMNDV